MTDRRSWPLAMALYADRISDATAEELAGEGIFHIELKGDTIMAFEAVDFVNRAKELVSVCKSHGVTVSSMHLPYAPCPVFDPSNPDPGARENLVRRQTELIKAAADAGIPKAMMHPSGEPYEDSERAERLKASADTVEKICRAASREGVTLCLENLPRKCLGRTIGEMMYYLDSIPDLMAVFDTNHSLIDDNAEFIRTLGKRIVSLHVSDYDFIDEKHLLPLEGKNDWEGIMRALEETGYSGRFLYELRVCYGYTFRQIADNYRKLVLG